MIFSQLNISKMSIQTEIVTSHFMYTNGISLIALQETGNWNPSQEAFPGCKIFQNNTDNNSISPSISGVALVANNFLQPEIITQLIDPDIDAVWVQIKLNGERIIVWSVYCKPTDGISQLRDLLSHLEKVFEFRDKHNFKSVLVYEDYNSRHQNWGDTLTNARGKLLQKFTSQFSQTLCEKEEIATPKYEPLAFQVLTYGRISRDVDQSQVPVVLDA